MNEGLTELIEQQPKKRLISFLKIIVPLFGTLLLFIAGSWYRSYLKQQENLSNKTDKIEQLVIKGFEQTNSRLEYQDNKIDLFRQEQNMEHQRINEKLDIQKKSLDKNSQQLIDRIDKDYNNIQRIQSTSEIITLPSTREQIVLNNQEVLKMAQKIEPILTDTIKKKEDLNSLY